MSLLLLPLIFINLVIIGITLYWVIKIGLVIAIIVFYLWFGVGMDTINEFFEGVIIGLNQV